MNNKILNDVIEKRNGHYCHVIEVNNVYDLISCIEALYNEFIQDYTAQDIIDFFDTIELYCLDDTHENAVYNFDIEQYIINL